MITGHVRTTVEIQPITWQNWHEPYNYTTDLIPRNEEYGFFVRYKRVNVFSDSY